MKKRKRSRLVWDEAAHISRLKIAWLQAPSSLPPRSDRRGLETSLGP